MSACMIGLDVEEVAVSVIIPAYNSSQIIHVALDSLVKQTMRDFEVIVVDDCSTDSERLRAVVESAEYRDLGIRLLRSEERLGQEPATNLGVSFAVGEYTALLDSDDEWHPDKLLICVERLRELNQQEGCRWIVHSRSLICRDDRTIKIMPYRAIARDETVAEYLFGPDGWMQTSTLVMRTEDARRIGFFRMQTDYRGKGDYEFCIRAASLGYLFHLVEQPLVAYRSGTDASAYAKGDTAAKERLWLKVMTPHLNRRDRFTFRAFLLSRKVKLDQGTIAAALVFLANFPFTSWRNQKSFVELIRSKIFGYRTPDGIRWDHDWKLGQNV